MLNNKKIVLSSIAIIFALVVCSIFVNYTLANSDSQASTAEQGSSKTTGLTGLTNIDIAINNSNDSTKKASGEDKFRIVQIVPDQEESIAEMDTALTKRLEKEDVETVVKGLKDEEYAKTSYLWRYVYNGEYFRLAVFNGYKTIESDMAEGAVTLTTCTVSQLNSMDTAAQAILNQADFVYIWANAATGAKSYGKDGSDISEELYNWLDAYTTVNNHPLGICTGALCTDKPGDIVGNNDTYRMGTFAYKIMTKGMVARFDNVLVTDADFFQKLFKEADDNKKNPDNPSTTNTISDFLLKASKSVNDDGYGFLTEGKNTYFKWYNVGDDAVTIEDFTDRKPTTKADTAYLRVGMAADKTGITTKRKSDDWNFDNAKILVISENNGKAMFDELKSKNSSTDNMADAYKPSEHDGDKVLVWTAQTRATNSVLTGNLYSGGKDGSNANVPSGADIYLITPEKLEASMKNGSAGLSEYSNSASFFKDVTTKTVSGVITTSDAQNIKLDEISLFANLLVKDGDKVYLTGKSCEVVKKTISQRDEEGNEILDENGKPVTEDVYCYEFTGLNPDYEYSVVLESVDGLFINTSEKKSDYRVGIAESDGQNVSQFDFTIDVVDSASVDGYTYRTTKTGETEVKDYNTVVVLEDFDENKSLTAELDSDPDKTSDMTGRYYKKTDTGIEARIDQMNIDLSDVANVVKYVTEKHNAYLDSQRALVDPFKINLEDYDFIFIDQGEYDKEISLTVTNGLKSAVEKGVYMIVSSKAGNGKGSGEGGGTNPGGKPSTIVSSPSAKAVADVINAGTYRDGTDNKFKVLEIQPDYPIDVELAESRKGSSGSSYTTHSDGTPITGDYYTVPSDVILGKAKEELPSQTTEYYDFDLTKAKIAYALKDIGVRYSDVDLTQVSTEALVGMSDDILATYDLVYLGGDISAVDKSRDEVYGYNPFGNDDAKKALGYGFPSFIMYTHTGVLQLVKANSTITQYPVMATGINGGTKDVWMPENGNDLTKTKYDQLSSYVASGRPIMISNELTSVYEKMNGCNVSGEVNVLSQVNLMSGYWFKDDGSIERGNMYLDPSSRMYKLLDEIFARKNSQTASNVLWGIDMSAEQMIDNADRKYGDGLWTVKQENGKQDIMLDTEAQKKDWYSNKSDSYQVYKKYAMVPTDDNCELISDLVKSSASRARITIVNKPTKYVQGMESTYITSTSLPFEFVVNGPLETYTYKLYVDKDKNGSFEENPNNDPEKDYYQSASFETGENVKVTVSLDDTFFGAAAWYLKIIDGNDKVVSTASGVSKVIRTIDGKADINVLQIQTMSKGQSADYQTMPDMLYFDIESQWAHKIMYYNGIADDVRFDSAMNLKQTSLLGRHENRFGIVEYDYSKSDDDWFSNLADALTDDYDINLDMVVATADHASFTTADNVNGTYNCLDTWVEEAEKLEANNRTGTDSDGHNIEYYTSELENKLDAYNTASNNVEAPKKALDEFLRGGIQYWKGNFTVTDNMTDEEKEAVKTAKDKKAEYDKLKGIKRNGSEADMVKLYQTALDTGEYYLLFLKYFTTVDITSDDSFASYGELGKLFKAYRDAKDAELDARDVYQTYLRRSYGKDFLKNMYSILVLGPSDDFGDFQIDLKQKTCDYIKEYVDAGGDLFFFHDTMTPYYKKGAYNLTTTLLDVVGMNRFHVDMTNQSNSYEAIELDNVTGSTTRRPAGVKLETLTEDGYKYENKEQHTEIPAGYARFTGTLTEACDVYDDENRHQNDSSWTKTNESINVIDFHNCNTSNRNQLVKKHCEAGEEVNDVYVHQDAIPLERLGVIDNNGKITDYKYFYKVPGKAGEKGYVYYDADDGGQPIISGRITDKEYRSKNRELYYLTPYSNVPALKQTAGIYNSMKANIMSSAYADKVNQTGNAEGIQISAMAMSSMYYAMDKSMGDGKYLNYIYACMDVNDAVKKTVRDGNHDETDLSQTAKASQLNEGLVTMYPFNIGSSLNISGTHQQAYSLDLENSNTKVWYTLAGCNNNSNKKAKSSMYAADPYDAMESYFIYTSAYGSGAVTYCGAGHTSVTGSKTKNNDERKLFINVIVNSAKAVQPAPTITCYEADKEWADESELPKEEDIYASTGKKVYVRDVDSKSDIPTFDYKITIPNQTKVTKVRLYYDLDYDDTYFKNASSAPTSPTYNPDTDKLITEYTAKGDVDLSTIAGEIKDIARNGANNNLKLTDAHFPAIYGGTYTYIVVEVYYQGKTKPVYALIKVKASDPLFELTDNTIDIPAYDYIAEKKNIFA